MVPSLALIMPPRFNLRPPMKYVGGANAFQRSALWGERRTSESPRKGWPVLHKRPRDSLANMALLWGWPNLWSSHVIPPYPQVSFTLLSCQFRPHAKPPWLLHIHADTALHLNHPLLCITRHSKAFHAHWLIANQQKSLYENIQGNHAKHCEKKVKILLDVW